MGVVRLSEVDGGDLPALMEDDLLGGHAVDDSVGVGLEQGDDVGFGEHDDPVHAVHLFGGADVAVVLDDLDESGWVVVLEEDFVLEVDEDLRARLLFTVDKDGGEGIADEEAIACDGDEDDQDEREDEDEFLHAEGRITAGSGKWRIVACEVLALHT